MSSEDPFVGPMMIDGAVVTMAHAKDAFIKAHTLFYDLTWRDRESSHVNAAMEGRCEDEMDCAATEIGRAFVFADMPMYQPGGAFPGRGQDHIDAAVERAQSALKCVQAYEALLNKG